MKKYRVTLELANKAINCEFSYYTNALRCKEFAKKKYEPGMVETVTEVEKEIFFTTFPEDDWDAEAENKAMVCLVSDALLPFHRMIFHAVAFVYKNEAFLITAPSGTGKSTQYKNLKELYGESIQIINGDNPVLHFLDDGTILVSSSPWKGKEGYGSLLQAPLKGIICLEQAEENKIIKMSKKEAVIPIFHGIMTYTKTEEVIHTLFELEKKMIESIPIFLYENTGTFESSQILFDTIRKEVLYEV